MRAVVTLLALAVGCGVVGAMAAVGWSATGLLVVVACASAMVVSAPRDASLVFLPLLPALPSQEAPPPLTLAEVPLLAVSVLVACLIAAVGVWVVLHATDTRRPSRGDTR